MGTYGYTGSTTTFTAINGGSYRITASGAQGGYGSKYSGEAGGEGAEVSGVFQLVAGEQLTIVVGAQGYSAYGLDGGGGGGGSFVIETFNGTTNVHQKLLIAGGGGGAGYGYQAYSAGAAGVAGAGGTGHGGAGSTTKGYGGGGGGGYSGGAGGGEQAGSTASGKPGGSGSSASGSYSGGGGYISRFNTQPLTGHGGFGGGGGGGDYGGGGGGGGYGGGAGGAGGTSSSSNGGGGGGSFDGGTQQSLLSGQNTGDGSVTVTALCFLRGTRILTPTGEARVEDLQIGDPVVTRFAGIQPVKWIGHHSPAAEGANTPVCIHAGALGERLPARDLYVSPGHSMLVEGSLLIARLLVNGVTITQDWCPPRIDYFHIELAAHDCVIAEGAWAETYADAHISRDRFANAAEYDALYPEDGPAPDEFTLCAPRPEHGAKLEAALRPVVARAVVSPGPLQGSIDQIDAWRVQGWAHDPAHPALPVLLEVELAGRVIGTVAACIERADLAQAGFGEGRCAFSFTAPVRLRPELLASLRIRRVADGAPLTMDSRCAMDLPIASDDPKRAGLRLVAV